MRCVAIACLIERDKDPNADSALSFRRANNAPEIKEVKPVFEKSVTH